MSTTCPQLVCVLESGHYLTNHSQTVCLGSVSSDPFIYVSGVLQGSVLGPLLFSLYISPIGQIISDFGISHQQYAEDAQHYIGLTSTNLRVTIACLQESLSALHSCLRLNPNKSESILQGTNQRLIHFLQ